MAFDTFSGVVLWDGRMREVMVLAADSIPLIGMALLDGMRVVLEVRENGRVAIEPLP